jgi:hypothetical protein
MRVALVRPGGAARQQPTSGRAAFGERDRRGGQVVSAGPRAARRAYRNRSSMMPEVVAQVRRADGELVPLRAATAGLRE